MDGTSMGTQLQPDDAAQIRATIAPFTRTCLARDWDTFLTMCTDDIVISGPGEPKATGEALRPWLENFHVQTEFTWDFDRLQVDGDLAVGSGSGSMTIEVEGEEVSSNFDFTDVLRKDQDGTWLYSSIIFNTNEPPA